MAGRLTIQRVPRGLLEILGMRASGDNPTELSSQLFGALDVTSLYLQDIIKVATLFLNPPVNAYNVCHTVPTGELWVVCNFGGLITSGATGAPSVSCFYQRKILAADWAPIGQPNASVVLGANQASVIGGLIPIGNLILQPGDTIGYQFNGTLTTVNAWAHIEYYRLTF